MTEESNTPAVKAGDDVNPINVIRYFGQFVVTLMVYVSLIQIEVAMFGTQTTRPIIEFVKDMTGSVGLFAIFVALPMFLLWIFCIAIFDGTLGNWKRDNG
jgi:hypothetical protein